MEQNAYLPVGNFERDECAVSRVCVDFGAVMMRLKDEEGESEDRRLTLSMLVTLTMLMMVKVSISPPVASRSRVQCTALPVSAAFPHHIVQMFAANQSGHLLTLYSRWWLMCSSISSRQPTILHAPLQRSQPWDVLAHQVLIT